MQGPEIVFGIWDRYGQPVTPEYRDAVSVGFQIYPSLTYSRIIVRDKDQLVPLLREEKERAERRRLTESLSDKERPFWFLIDKQISYFESYNSNIYVGFANGAYCEINFPCQDFGPVETLCEVGYSILIKSVTPEKLMTLSDGHEIQLHWSGDYRVDGYNKRFLKMIQNHA